MTVLRAAAQAAIEAGVDQILTRLIGTGRAIIFQRKVEEAKMVQANPQIAASEVPLLAEDVLDRGGTIPQAAQRVGQRLKKVSAALATIERRQLAAERRVAEAVKPADLKFVTEIDWEDMYQKAKALLT